MRMPPASMLSPLPRRGEGRKGASGKSAQNKTSFMISSFGRRYCARINAPAVRGHFTASERLRTADRRNDFDKSEGISAVTAVRLRSTGILQHSSWDALFVALALAHGLALIGFP